ncbi:hypothetical protein DL96DRAFT_1541868, partial [Flagelloscypha sp. PMI_526]
IPVCIPPPEGKFDAIPNNGRSFAITTSHLRPVSSRRGHITTSSGPRQNPLISLDFTPGRCRPSQGCSLSPWSGGRNSNFWCTLSRAGNDLKA